MNSFPALITQGFQEAFTVSGIHRNPLNPGKEPSERFHLISSTREAQLHPAKIINEPPAMAHSTMTMEITTALISMLHPPAAPQLSTTS